jgi:DNA-directed RNA polymerase subunit G
VIRVTDTMLSEVMTMSFETTCKIENMQSSYLPDISIMELSCNDNIKIKMDIHRKVNIFKVGEKVSVIISKSLPQYVEGRDFVAHGYVISKRMENSNYVIYISLWGFILILSTQKPETFSEFKVMDKVYVKIVPQS